MTCRQYQAHSLIIASICQYANAVISMNCLVTFSYCQVYCYFDAHCTVFCRLEVQLRSLPGHISCLHRQFRKSHSWNEGYFHMSYGNVISDHVISKLGFSPQRVYHANKIQIIKYLNFSNVACLGKHHYDHSNPSSVRIERIENNQILVFMVIYEWLLWPFLTGLPSECCILSIICILPMIW